jgi:NADP-dependent 3-hydroxy acid dehydrogenase YdfG
MCIQPNSINVQHHLPFDNQNQGKIACITGASSGIGLSSSLYFASKGYHVILLARRHEKLTELETLLTSLYPVKTYLICADVTNENEIRNAFDALPDSWKKIDILLNNAGKAKGFAPFQEGSPEHWEEMIDTNIKGLIYVSRAIIPLMMKHKSGFIINVGSIAGRQTYPNGNVYCASKAAVQALTEGMRIDLHTHNIRVASISPGHVEDTEFAIVRFDGDKNRANIYSDFNPLTAFDIAETIYFMASRPAHVTIQDVIIMSTQQPTATIVNRNGRTDFPT